MKLNLYINDHHFKITGSYQYASLFFDIQFNQNLDDNENIIYK